MCSITKNVSRKSIVIILVATLLLAVCFEIYAHIYIKIANLPVVSSADVLKLPYISNDTYILSANGAEWLLALKQFNVTSEPAGLVLFIFKIKQNTNFYIQSIDLIPENLQVNLGIKDSSFSTNLTPYYTQNSNCTIQPATYTFSPGTYNCTFNFKFKIYESTLLGISTVNETTVQFYETKTYPI